MKLSATNLQKKFGAKVAVEDISLEINSGQTLGLLGPNGSGKSTTIKMLTGQLFPDAGEIFYDDKNLKESGRDINKLIGVMPQEIIIWDHLTIKENLEFTATLHKMPKEIADKRIKLLMDKLKLDSEVKTQAKDLSGGYKRRLNLAISVLHDPKVIFLDEPTPGIDPQSRKAMWEFIDDLKKTNNYSILLTDHYLDEAEKACDYIIIIDQGKIVTKGTLRELRKAHGDGKILQIDLKEETNTTEEKYKNFENKIKNQFGEALIVKNKISIPAKEPEKEVPQVLGLLKTHAVEFDDIMIKETSLEDIFLLLTGKEIRE